MLDWYLPFFLQLLTEIENRREGKMTSLYLLRLRMKLRTP
jgi:hypothetical protein